MLCVGRIVCAELCIAANTAAVRSKDKEFVLTRTLHLSVQCHMLLLLLRATDLKAKKIGAVLPRPVMFRRRVCSLTAAC